MTMKQQKSRFMIKKYPNALVTEDCWGDFPLTSALYAQASMEDTYPLPFQDTQGTCLSILPQ
jgi:hypothetical protein